MYAEVKDNQVVTWPYDYDNLVKQNPNTSFASDIGFIAMYTGTEANLAGNSLVKVAELPQPQYNQATQMVVHEDEPALVDGEWVLGWKIVDMTDDQKTAAANQKAHAVRADRNNRLAQSDWTQLSDSPEADKAAWVTYRQALRDVPTQTGFPWEVQWPTKPE